MKKATMLLNKQKGSDVKKSILLLLGAVFCACLGSFVLADQASVTLPPSGLGGVAAHAKDSLKGFAQLVTAAAYVAGMGFAVAAVLKFKAHKDNPTQVALGMPIAMLFIAIALIFIPTIFKVGGGTLFGSSGSVAGVSGLMKFS